MKKEEKELIYNLLKVTDSYINGYQRDCFSTSPSFADDEVKEEINIPKEKSSILYQAVPVTPTKVTPLPSSDSHISNGMTMEELNNKIYRCTRCGLARTRNNVVPGEGVPHPDVLVIGEGPGSDEDIQGKPFVGKAGVLLDKMLNSIQLDRHTNCFIGNIVKCRPPMNRNPFPDEQDTCFPFLETQIHILKPKMILCLGKVAIEKMLGQKLSITANHGVFYDYKGIPMMATYHPSALLRNPELKRPAWEDLKGFRIKLNEIRGI